MNSEDISMNDKEKLTMDYHSNMHKIEQELSDVKAKKKTLEEVQEKLFEFKRRDIAFYNQLRAELHEEHHKQDQKAVDELLGETQYICRQLE